MRTDRQRLFLKAFASGDYACTRRGQVFSWMQGKKRRLAVNLSRHGYPRTRLQIDGKSYWALTHQLVTLFFWGRRSSCWQVNHRDGNKKNNALSNLELVTHLQNAQHAVLKGLYRRGEKHGRAALSARQVRTLRAAWRSGKFMAKQLAEKYGVSRSTAHKAATGRTYAGRGA